MSTDYLNVSPSLTQNRSPFNYEKIEQVSRDIATAWLTLDEITQQINNWDDESQDDYLQSLELAVRMAIEDYLGMPIFPTQFKVYYGNPGQTGTAVMLDLPEVSQINQGQAGVTINSVGYYTGTVPSVFTTLATTAYQYDPTGNQVIVNSFPNNISTQIANPLVVTYTANRSPIANYPVVKQAGLLLFTHLYNNRSNTTVEKLKEIPFGVAALLRPYKPLVM